MRRSCLKKCADSWKISAKMHYRLFVVFAFPSWFIGECSVHSSPPKVLAFEGGFVILPCSFITTTSSDIPTVEWSKEGLVPNVVFLYRNGYETTEMKNSDFEYRTNLLTKELQNGNISLRISNVQLSDAGKYHCLQIWKNALRVIATVELVVGAVSKPKLSVVSAECNKVTLECEANYSLAKPEIKFLDDQGNDILPDDPKRDKDASGCCTVRRRLTHQTTANSITCRVHKQESNLVIDTEILILADCMRSPFLTTGGTILILVFFCGLAFCLLKRCGTCAKGKNQSGTRRVSVHSTFSITIENSPRGQSNGDCTADNVGNGVIEMLTREVAHVKLQLQARDKTIHQLLSSVVSESTRPMVCCPSVSSLDVPKAFLHSQKACLMNYRRNSSPAVFPPVLSSSCSTSRSKKKKSNCKSEPHAWPYLNLAKPHLRHSSVIASTNLPVNSYNLVDVIEEFEPIIACEKLHF